VPSAGRPLGGGGGGGVGGGGGSAAQKAACAAAFAKPPGASGVMSSVALSPKRFSWYSAPAKPPNSARTTLCAAAQGVPAAP